MTEQEIYDGVIMNGTTDFALVVETLRRHGVGWCVIGGLAVNTYTQPVYTADSDLVVVAGELDSVLADLRAADFRVKEFAFSINAQRRTELGGQAASKLLVQFTKLTRYQPFIKRAALRSIFGVEVPVATLPDVIQDKIWAWGDPTRRASKRAKDESDLLRLGEGFPEVRNLLPETLRRRLDDEPTNGLDSWDNIE